MEHTISVALQRLMLDVNLPGFDRIRKIKYVVRGRFYRSKKETGPYGNREPVIVVNRLAAVVCT
jgi:hypothetical protein